MNKRSGWLKVPKTLKSQEKKKKKPPTRTNSNHHYIVVVYVSDFDKSVEYRDENNLLYSFGVCPNLLDKENKMDLQFNFVRNHIER